MAFTDFYFNFWSCFFIFENFFGVVWSVGIVWMVGVFMIGGLFLMIICDFTNNRAINRTLIFTIVKGDGAWFLRVDTLCSCGERLWLKF